MSKKRKKKGNYCCDLMDTFTRDPRVGVSYYPKTRAYYIDLLDGPAKQGIFYCPFCGSKLPSSLRDKYFKLLGKKFKIKDPFDEEQTQNISEEFKSDEWWKKRGL